MPKKQITKARLKGRGKYSVFDWIHECLNNSITHIEEELKFLVDTFFKFVQLKLQAQTK